MIPAVTFTFDGIASVASTISSTSAALCQSPSGSVGVAVISAMLNNQQISSSNGEFVYYGTVREITLISVIRSTACIFCDS